MPVVAIYDRDLHRRIKILTAKTNTTISGWVEQACEDALARAEQKPPQRRERVKLEGLKDGT